MAAAQALGAAAAFVATAYLARTLETRLFGVMALAQTVAAYVALFSDMGVHIAGINRIAAGEDPRRVVSAVLGLRLFLAAAVFAFAALLLAVLGKPWAWTWPMLVFMLSIFPQALFLDWAFRGMQRMGSTGFAVLLKSAVFVAAVFLFVRGPSDLEEAAWAWTASSAVMTGVLLLIFAKGRGAVLPRPSAREWKALLSAGIPLGLSFILLQLYLNLNVLLIGVLRGAAAEEEMAFYSAAFRIVLFFLFIASSFGFALHPVLAADRAGTSRGALDVGRLVSRGLRFCLYLSVPAAVGGTLLSREIITFVYGSGYAPAADVFRIVVWQVPLVFAGVSFSQVLLASGGGRRVLAAVSAGLALNAALAAVLVPRAGVVGAAASALAGECVIQSVMIACAWKAARPAGYLRSLAACGLASGAMAAAALLSGGHVIARIALCAAVYAAVLAVLELLLFPRFGRRAGPA